MAHEPENEPDDVPEALEEQLPGRDSLLVECGRALKEASPAWAERLMRELELMLRPHGFGGMGQRHRTSCDCGETILVRRDDGEKLPARTDGPGMLGELSRCLKQTHGERAEEILDQVRQMVSMPVPYPTAQEAGDDPMALGLEPPPQPSRCPWCGAGCTIVSEFYCPPCGMG